MRVLKRLSNNSAIVLCMCRRKFPDYKQKKENRDRLDDFKVGLCSEQRISVCLSLHKKAEMAMKKGEGTSGCYCYYSAQS